MYNKHINIITSYFNMFYFQTLYYFFTLTQLRCFLTLILIRSTRKKYLKRIFDNRWKKKVKENLIN